MQMKNLYQNLYLNHTVIWGFVDSKFENVVMKSEVRINLKLSFILLYYYLKYT